MSIADLPVNLNAPPLYEAGTDFMWTHPHISKQLLSIHLDPDIELASRRKSTIDITVNWIASHAPKVGGTILDLGCGPGLYCTEFARKGYAVSGIDISRNSIAYAEATAAESALSIEYRCDDYTKANYEDSRFDLVTMVFTDFGVLPPHQQAQLLDAVYRWLKPGGKFIFDVMADSGYHRALSPRTWEYEPSGFWRSGPYFHLSESIPYDDASVILWQHIVIESDAPVAVYRFWTHYFSREKIRAIFGSTSFARFQIYDSVIPDSDFCLGKDVYFIVAEK